jgi:aminoglycoside phosphotransferase (APT) family kinase protein
VRSSPPHGFALAPDEHRLLRGAPPPRALRWCEVAVGPRARVAGFAALAGGTSSAVHAVDVRDARGRTQRLVLRRFVRPEWLEEEPDAPRREAAALALAAGCPIPTPGLVALDASGGAAGAPAVLMTRLDGEIDWRPADLEAFLRRLAGVLPALHATPAPDGALPAYSPYELEDRRPPPWSRRPDVWQRAFDVFDGPAPHEERRFIHRDYHPGNVLWRAGTVSGVVDWASASIGSPSADVGHCRINLAGAIGIEAADRFLALYRAVSGRDTYHPYWDVVAALGGNDRDDWTADDERFLTHALRAR